jgi:hypothetical protein
MNDFAGEVREATTRELRGADLRPSGLEHFEAMSEAEQDEKFGPDLAAKLRSGEVKLSDLILVDGTFIRATRPTNP